MRFPSVVAYLLAVSVALGAAGPLSLPAPLAPPGPVPSPGEIALDIASAQRAQDLGFPGTAVTLYRSMLASPGPEAGRVALALASALLDQGDIAEAGRVLEASLGQRSSAWHLRMGLVNAGLHKNEAARSELAAVHADDLSPGERGWHLFLQGLVADAESPVRAAGYYRQAEAAAVSDLQRARFVLAEEQARLRSGGVGDAQLEADRKNAAAYQGQKIGYGFAREYAIALNAAGRRQQSIDALQAELRTLPPEEHSEVDHTRLLLGLIAGAGAGVGRHELFELLSSGVDPDRQRVALQLLVRSSQSGALRLELDERLGRLIGEPKPSAILDSLLLCRAELGLGEAHLGGEEPASAYGRAEADAQALLERFPGSALKAHAYAVLAGSAWEQQRYRTAADYASSAGAAIAPGPVRAEFAVLAAEAWFRAGLKGRDPGDFRSAADAYQGALRARPEGVRPGLLMFQRIQAEIEARALPAAVSVLDELSRDPEFDSQDRWEAEWNLARALEARGDTAEALARVNALLSGAPPAGLEAGLRARMAWLRARLSYDAGKPADTLRFVDDLRGSSEGLPAALGADIGSMGALLRAQAQFELGRDADAEDTLHRLRTDYPTSESAVYSYIVEADRLARQDKVVDAQRLLTQLADQFPDSTYAPYAIYQAALQAERLGTEKSQREGYLLLESLVTNPRYASSELIFPARMREGDLLREMNQFPQAQEVYELLVNNPTFAQTPDGILAQLALAECHNAQSANEPSHADTAMRIFEDLVERVDAPADVRVEAGYNLGEILARRGDRERAQAVWWGEVVDPFLIRAGGSGDLGPKGRWWIARSLLEVGSLYEQQGKIEEAKRAWRLVLDSGLPGGAAARERLARFHLRGGQG